MDKRFGSGTIAQVIFYYLPIEHFKTYEITVTVLHFITETTTTKKKILPVLPLSLRVDTHIKLLCHHINKLGSLCHPPGHLLPSRTPVSFLLLRAKKLN